ncbi:hypothetical protein KIL84_000172 [Mauremys mutica]|uniref:Uncharacterized protein n=1 Tax=Mauremys mutica TaxID=74926 RepID=A0A9D3XFR9_9SAUR|nr:hypothetical protein KIL84_000172 [Mauremys mutica]
MGWEDTRVGILALMSYVIGAEVPGLASRKHLCIKSVKSALTDGSPKERPMRSLPLGGRLEKTVQKTSLATLEIIIASGRGLSQRHLRLPSSCWPGSWCCQHPPSREKGAEWLRCSC